ncbi:TrmH family RNA methyltransferase [Kocuria marina]|uniref:TrmH family RNA methyltransferase n=1 Tax=Kocuria marina TaxID=223184 RepID=UPI0011AA71DD|nr:MULTISPECIES: RNA methyltransferase [Kocuria]MCT2022080.1 RNA methyltransferase [Kocuria marina]
MTFVERLEDRLLSNPRADRVKDVAGLTRRSVRSKRGLFRAEGPQNVREALLLALADSPAPGLPRLDAVYVTLQELDRHPVIAADLAALAERGDVFVRAVTPEVLAAMTDAVTPQGMLAVCRFACESSDDDVARTLGAARLVGVLVRVQDPGNAGTVIRTADAAGSDAVLCTPGTVDPFNPKSVRSSAGSLFHVPVLTGVELADVVAAAREHGMGLLAADGHASVAVSELADAAVLRAAGAPAADAAYPLEQPTAWLFGNEAQGLSEAEVEAADVSVAVPLYGAAESLNVATAATVCLYASAQAQRRITDR